MHGGHKGQGVITRWYDKADLTVDHRLFKSKLRYGSGLFVLYLQHIRYHVNDTLHRHAVKPVKDLINVVFCCFCYILWYALLHGLKEGLPVAHRRYGLGHVYILIELVAVNHVIEVKQWLSECQGLNPQGCLSHDDTVVGYGKHLVGVISKEHNGSGHDLQQQLFDLLKYRMCHLRMPLKDTDDIRTLKPCQQRPPYRPLGHRRPVCVWQKGHDLLIRRDREFLLNGCHACRRRIFLDSLIYVGVANYKHLGKTAPVIEEATSGLLSPQEAKHRVLGVCGQVYQGIVVVAFLQGDVGNIVFLCQVPDLFPPGVHFMQGDEHIRAFRLYKLLQAEVVLHVSHQRPVLLKQRPMTKTMPGKVYLAPLTE
ncbi:hypothetical protein MBAV_001166 [Candidatus Magnetobacterium bavaricum]|uniref:Uncharacterized protein n=1 Tax=Candidatus Magnetobacterium bavaricum TaxID=29290 RepID=A0A0F3GXC7_9BACT|nr:hypothetical protein MBAV_001166 [Candidatus Magnetobacterium bavaricum]